MIDGVVAATDVGDVGAGAAGELVSAAQIVVDVAFGAAEEPVVARAAVELVVAGDVGRSGGALGHQGVFVVAADGVIASAAGEDVVAGVAVDLVIAAAAVDVVIASAALDQVAAAAAVDLVVAVSAVEGGVGEVAGDGDSVVAGIAVDQQLFDLTANEGLGTPIQMHDDLRSGGFDGDVVGSVGSVDCQDAAGETDGEQLAGLQLFDETG